MYDRLIRLRGAHQDRVRALRVSLCGLLTARPRKHDPERSKWWNWSDANL